MSPHKEKRTMSEMLPQIKTFEIRDSDIFLVGYPKSGTTWAQEMIWLIVNGINFQGTDVCIDERFPTLEMCGYDLEQFNSNIRTSDYHEDSINFIQNMASPRLIRSHLPAKYLPEQLLSGEKKTKVIYIARNVQDVCLSLYHYTKNLVKMHNLSLDDFCNGFLTKEGNISPGRYWEHVLYFWERRHEKHILFIKYEEMKNDASGVIQRVSNFLNKTLTKEQEIKLIKLLNFDLMKERPTVNRADYFQESGFMRVGKVGEHQKEMHPELIAKFDIWCQEYIKDSDYQMV